MRRIVSCRNVRQCWLAITTCTLICGCGGGSSRPTLAPVNGIVLYAGRPVEGAVVEFLQEKSPVRSMGYTDANGGFQLTSYVTRDGAPLGLNKVAVTKRTKVDHPGAAEPETVPLESISDPHERRQASMKNSVEKKFAADPGGAGKNAKPRDLLPVKYAKTETSGLEFTVKAGADNMFQIVLTD